MIKTLRCAETRKVFIGKMSRKLPADIQRIAQRKLRYLKNARNLKDLRVPPANRLEAWKGERKGQYSIRIKQQWRICFVWSNGDAFDVEIVDYH